MKKSDNAPLQTGCLGVPEFLHQLQLQTQVGNGKYKKKDWKINGNQKEEGWEKTMGKKKRDEESNGKEKCEWKWKR